LEHEDAFDSPELELLNMHRHCELETAAGSSGGQLRQAVGVSRERLTSPLCSSRPKIAPEMDTVIAVRKRV
jgi:hypothetical protein